MKLIDTPGLQHGEHHAVNNIIPAHVVICLYDATDKNDFQHCEEFIKKHKHDDTKIWVIAGNKSELRDFK
jgi:GTPase SAR1 family protein